MLGPFAPAPVLTPLEVRLFSASEIGIDMSRFPSAVHLVSRACICPRNDESAGKRRSNRVH